MGTLDGEESMLTKTSIIFCPAGTVVYLKFPSCNLSEIATHIVGGYLISSALCSSPLPQYGLNYFENFQRKYIGLFLTSGFLI